MLPYKRNQLTKEQQDLIENNMGLYFHWFNKHNIFDEDIQQSLLLSLCDFIHLYDPKKGKYGTFVGVVFFSKLSLIYRRGNTKMREKDKTNISLQDPIKNKFETSDATTYEDIIEYSEKGFDEIDNKDMIENALKNLSRLRISDHDIEVFMSYANTGSQITTGKIFNISRQRVSQIIIKVRKAMKERGYIVQ